MIKQKGWTGYYRNTNFYKIYYYIIFTTFLLLVYMPYTKHYGHKGFTIRAHIGKDLGVSVRVVAYQEPGFHVWLTLWARPCVATEVKVSVMVPALGEGERIAQRQFPWRLYRVGRNVCTRSRKQLDVVLLRTRVTWTSRYRTQKSDNSTFSRGARSSSNNNNNSTHVKEELKKTQ